MTRDDAWVQITKSLAWADWTLRFSRLVERSLGVILLYHTIDDPTENSGPMLVTRTHFRQQLALLSQRYDFCTLTDLFTNQSMGGRKRAVLTFDDGFRSFLDVAWPTLCERRIPATLFVNSALLGRRDLATRAEIRELGAQPGLEVGNHTRTHIDLSVDLPPAALEQEIIGGREDLEDLVGKRVRAFAYPWGRWNAAAGDVVRRSHDFAVTANSGVVWPDSDRAFLNRVMAVSDSIADFAFALTDVRQVLRPRPRT